MLDILIEYKQKTLQIKSTGKEYGEEWVFSLSGHLAISDR